MALDQHEETLPYTPMPPSFGTHPSRYRHWKLRVEGDIARLAMDVQQDILEGEDGDYARKLNSYDIHVDVELADAIERLRFEHPEVRTLVVESAKDRVFCSGANIFMLGSSSHGFKVNFCKFTNETRLYLEDASQVSGLRSLAALNGPCAGGGYELALACDEILLIDDRSSAVSLPEAPLLAVLPGTGGLTRVVDKRKVRPDLADAFSTTAEGVKGKRAVEWGLVDTVAPRSRFAEAVSEKARNMANSTAPRGLASEGVALEPVEPEEVDSFSLRWRHVQLGVDPDARTACLTVSAPSGPSPETAAEIHAQGSNYWALRVWREVDDALLRLRFHYPTVNVVSIKTLGDPSHVLSYDRALLANASHWFVREVLHKVKRVLKRLDLMAKSLFAVIEPNSAFAGQLFELALAADRSYMLQSDHHKPYVQLSAINDGALPMGNGLSRLARRFLHDPAQTARALSHPEPLGAETAIEFGLVTFAPDELDWDDELRIAVEERASLSPDALTGMEANLRFAGPETLETKIFGRLSAWQNWIFQRPNAVGSMGALTLYGRPERPQFDWRRT